MGPSEYYHWIFPSLWWIDTLKYPLHAMHTYSFTPPHTTQIPLILPDIIQGVEGWRHERNIRWHECTPHPSCTKHCYCFPHLRGCCSAYRWSQGEVFIWTLIFHYQFQFPPLSPLLYMVAICVVWHSCVRTYHSANRSSPSVTLSISQFSLLRFCTFQPLILYCKIPHLYQCPTPQDWVTLSLYIINHLCCSHCMVIIIVQCHMFFIMFVCALFCTVGSSSWVLLYCFFFFYKKICSKAWEWARATCSWPMHVQSMGCHGVED